MAADAATTPTIRPPRRHQEDDVSKRVAFLVASEGIEQVELTDPWKAVTDAGHEAVLVSPEGGEVQMFNHLDKGDTKPVDVTVADAKADDFDALVLPGGVANPDNLRTHDDAVALVREFVASGKPVAAICHAPWTLVEADVLKGRRLTSWPSLQTDIRNAGGQWVDEPLVVDENLITSRKPDDLPDFCGAVVEALEHGAAARSA
ncbi:type 1 glutamine amidotransferase domain-containing protein [Terrabacter terrigena]